MIFSIGRIPVLRLNCALNLRKIQSWKCWRGLKVVIVDTVSLVAPVLALMMLRASAFICRVKANQSASSAILRASGKRQAFTLLELLAVVSIVAVMLVLVVPAVTGIKKGGELSKAISEIAGTLEQARAYAMANNTYVWVGFSEYSIPSDTSGKLQPGTGHVVVAAVASKNGMREFDSTGGNGVGNLAPLGPVRQFSNLHLIDLRNSTSGKMKRPGITDTANVIPYTPASPLSFAWPLGKAGSGRFDLTNVLGFDPRGVARIQTATNREALAHYLEVGICQTRGAYNASNPSPNLAAIQIDCIGGAVRIYRP